MKKEVSILESFEGEADKVLDIKDKSIFGGKYEVI